MLNVDLSSFIRLKIETEGPIPLKEFLTYVSKVQNEHISPQYLNEYLKNYTANNTSYIFEKIIAEWCLKFWETHNKPTKLKIIIFSPKTGSLIPKILKHFYNTKIKESIKIYIVESNPYLTKYQKQNLKNYSNKITWVTKFEKIPINSFSITIADKFFSSLPIDQYTRKKGEWVLNTIDLSRDGQHFCISHLNILNKNMIAFLNQKYPHIQDGEIIELHDNATTLLKKAFDNIKKFKGGILLTDYGYTNQNDRPFISSLQAKNMKKWHSPFHNIGRNFISSQLNFSNLKENIELHGGQIHGPINQRNFLVNMKIEERKSKLLEQLPDSDHLNIISEYKTLTSKTQIGYLLKAMLICNPPYNSIGF